MKINEIEELIEEEKSGELRKPNCMIAKSDDEQKAITLAFRAIAFFTKQNLTSNIFDYVDDREERSALKELYYSSIVNVFKGCGTKDEPFEIETTFGDGICCDDSSLLSYKERQAYEHGNCFTNAYYLAASLTKAGYVCKQLSGIAYLDEPFLHSVVYIENEDHEPFILDFNYDMIMSYDLFVKFLIFEVLAETKGKDIVKAINFVHKADKNFKFEVKNYQLAFALNEVLKDYKLKLKQYLAGVTTTA